MAGPAAVIAAGIVTVWLAISHDDGLVADDYYKQGLAINRVIARDAQARALGIEVDVSFREGGVSVALRGDEPEALVLSLRHPTRAGQDRLVRLQSVGGGRYEGALDVPGHGRWHLVVSDEAGHWRLAGEWALAGGPRTTLTASEGGE